MSSSSSPSMREQPAGEARQVPLCVELDGTLAWSDLGTESMLSALKRAPWLLPLVLFWRLFGKARLNEELSRRGEIDVTVLPYNGQVVELVQAARKEGRTTVLACRGNPGLARKVQEYLGIFDEILEVGSSGRSGTAGLAAELAVRFGDQGFEYVSATGVADPVWRAASAVVTINGSSAVLRKSAEGGKPHRNFEIVRPSLRPWLKAMRLHQWAKNALLFVPLVTAHAIFDATAVARVALAFLCFGLCASATYIINDLLDLDADRHHQKKRNRPFASGSIPVKAGVLGCSAMLLAGLGLSLPLPGIFQLALLAYIVTTLLYSFRLKRVASLDVLTLAGLYTLRVVAGGFAAAVPLSFWLLAFSMFIFLCLALVKRVAELLELRTRQQLGSAAPGKARGREYKVEDIPVLQNLGAASGYMAVLVLALYINSPEVAQLYQTPQILWLIAPLMLLWVTRLWVVTTRGYMDEDPILFAVKDPETWVTAAITAAILAGATLFNL